MVDLNPILDPRQTDPLTCAAAWGEVGFLLWASACVWPLWVGPLVTSALRDDR